MNPRSFLPPVGRFLAVAGSVCLLGPIVGFAYTVWTMLQQMGAVSTTGAAIDSAALGSAVRAALVVTAYGLGLGLLGTVLVHLACSVFRYAAPWMRGFLLVGALPLLAAFPVGTFLAFGLLRLRRNPRLSARNADA